MYRVYVGNLDEGTTEETLRSVFADHGLPVSSVLVKKGYGFVDCPDQTSFDMTIDRLNGLHLQGSVLQVEPSTVSKTRRSNKLQIRNFPQQVAKEELEHLVADFGTVLHCDIVNTSVESYVTVVYEYAKDAQKAFDQLNNYDFHGSVLRGELMNTGGTRATDSSQNLNANNSSSAYTLWMLVSSGYIGAIIGKKGETIRRITSETGVLRIDVHGKEQSGLIEKIVAITGKTEAVSSACKEILKIMAEESTKNNTGEITLKILAEDRFCGRIIGKEGSVIKKLREDTGTKIVVSNALDMAALYPDRIVTVSGPVDNLSLAEEAISKILRDSYEKDTQQSMLPASKVTRMNFGAAAPMCPGIRPQKFMNLPSFQMVPKSHGSGEPNGPDIPETYYISVPNAAVGSIIGIAGANIKQIMRSSGAHVNIEPKRDSEPGSNTERSITIKGTPEAFWRASYHIFDKMKLEGFAGNDDVRLRTYVKIPKSAAGRVIGKNGKNARDIEHITGAIVRVTEDTRTHDDEEALVEVFGSFMATQGAIGRIRNVLNHTRVQSSTGTGEPANAEPAA